VYGMGELKFFKSISRIFPRKTPTTANTMILAAWYELLVPVIVILIGSIERKIHYLVQDSTVFDPM
jgi:hypothetical protein